MKQTRVGVLGIGAVEPALPVLHAEDLGLTRGDGCFEATRVVTDAAGSHRIDHLSEHLDRFDRSCAGLQLPPIDRDAWWLLIDELLQGWSVPGEAMLRLMISRGRESTPAGPITGIATLTPIAAETLRQRAEGISVITLNRGFDCDAFADAPWLLGGVKTLSYAVNVAATREAVRRGANDVIFTSTDGKLLEAPTSTVLWHTGGALHSTPPGASGVLASITQQALFAAAESAGYHCRYLLGTAEDLLSADGAWLVSSGRGVAGITTLDGRTLTDNPAMTGQLTALAGF